MEFIESHPDKPWRWGEFGISSHPNITMEFIDSHPDKYWDWGYISMNPNITMEIIDSHPVKEWDWDWISGNKFDKHPFIMKKSRIRERVAWLSCDVLIPDMNREVSMFI